MARPIQPLRWPLEAELELPGSKSVANRALIAAALSGRRTRIEGATPCDDVRHLVHGLAALGFESEFEDEARGRVSVGPRAVRAASSAELFCGNAGTALRFLVSVAALTPGEWRIDGDEHMRRRPIEPLVAAWRALGVEIEATRGCPPLCVRGGTSRGGHVALDASISSQYLSSLLLVGAQLERGLEIEFGADLSSVEYARMTVQVAREFGVRVELGERGARVQPGARSECEHYHVPGDWSAMGTWSCLAELTDSTLTGSNLSRASGQADEQLEDGIRHLRGLGARELNVSPFPDQFMNLAVLAARRPERTRLVGAANLRVKECDRIAVTARELRRIGVRVRELADGLEIEGARALRPARIDPEGDHRIAMAFALAGLLSPGIEIEDADCVAKSYPDFWRDLERVCASTRCVSVVGMRGVGKSRFARALAERSGREWIDSDRELERVHGPIAELVAVRGWEVFRQLEAELLRELLRERAVGSILSLGGGALQRSESFDLVRSRSIPIWLEAPVSVLRARLAADAGQRPALTAAGVLAELEQLERERRPTYLAIATQRLDATRPLDEMVALALEELASLCRW